ncbi:MAG: small multi-drug export protein [Owenweeksia sp.]|nr:small multi-drug export protein [Owenweeksia sp.]
MIDDLIQTFLISISPFGEARVGIPFGVLKGLHPVWAFVAGVSANLLVFPIFMWLIQRFDKQLWKFKPYKKTQHTHGQAG